MKKIVVLSFFALVGCIDESTKVKEYPHAVGFCGGDEPREIHHENMSLLVYEDIHIVVNPGHAKDPQVLELIQLTREACTKVKQKNAAFEIKQKLQFLE